MIDMSKYEGITKGAEEDGGVRWRVVADNFVMNDETPQPDWRFIGYVEPLKNGTDRITGFSEADANLIADAPLLLEAYRELQDYHTALLNWVMNHLDRDEDEVKEMIYE